MIQPVVAHRAEDGTLHVLYGQRRALAAVENKLTQMPVYIVDSLTEADRLEAWGYTLSDVERIITDHEQEAEDNEPGHSLAEIQAEEEEMIAEEAATE